MLYETSDFGDTPVDKALLAAAAAGTAAVVAIVAGVTPLGDGGAVRVRLGRWRGQ